MTFVDVFEFWAYFNNKSCNLDFEHANFVFRYQQKRLNVDFHRTPRSLFSFIMLVNGILATEYHISYFG